MSAYAVNALNNKAILGEDVIFDQCPISDTQPSNNLSHYPKPTTYNRAECTCSSVRFFAILSMQRSGCGWFETLLNSHPNVSSNGEIFSVKPRRNNASTVFSTLDKGVLKYHEEVVDYFQRRGVSGIFLLRRNLLNRMVSIIANTYDQSTKPLNGTHKSHVHSKTEAKVLASYRPRIDVSTLIPDLRRAEDMASEAIEYFKSTRHLIVYYEDIVNNHTKLIDVLDFLEIPQRNLFSRQVKIHTKPLWDQIENFEEVQDTLNGTKYSKFLDYSTSRSRPVTSMR